MISAIIIDDEAKGRLALREKIAAYCPQINLIAEASDGFEAMQLINLHQPHLIFLDIEMPKMNGFEMLNGIKEKNFQLIFTTAYDHYAIKAIKYAAFDYLLKPIDIEELKTAILNVERIKTNDSGKEKIQLNDQVAILQQNMQVSKNHFHKLAIPTLEGLLFYDINDIIHLEANSNYTNIYLKNKIKVVASKTLKEFEELLPEDIFFRCHHSFLINLHYIKRYIRGDGGQIELDNGSMVEVSRRKKEEFLKKIRQ